MYIYNATNTATSERGAKTIAKRNPWRVSYKQVIERGAVVEDGAGNWWIYTNDAVANGVYGDNWHKLAPSSRVDQMTGRPEPVSLDMYE